MRILLVDDEIVALNALKKRVDWLKYGFTEVYTAQDVKTAKEQLKNKVMDMILCDVEMPGEDGLSLVKYVKEHYPKTECVMVTCHADFDYIRSAMRSGVRDYVLKPIDYEELDQLLLQFLEECRSKKAKNELNRIVEKTEETKGKDNRIWTGELSEERMNTVKLYVEEHIHEKINVSTLARQVHINEQYLMRTFKRETGQSITEYITERRIIIASNLLRDTDHSINFISDCVGCENYSYFTKLFKKMTGFTPREYRAQFKKS